VQAGNRLLALFVSILLIVTAILPVYADEIDKAQQELQDVSRQIESQKSQLNQIKQQEKSIMGQLQNLEQDMVDKEKQIEILAARIHALEEDIKATEEEIAQKEEELQVQIDYLCERLLYMYEDGMDVSYLEVLFSATNIRDFLTRYDLLQYVVEQDMNLIDTINKNKRALDIKKNDLEIQKKELLTMREVQEAQRRQLEEQAEQKQEILSNVRVEKKAYEKALEELERASRDLGLIFNNSLTCSKLSTLLPFTSMIISLSLKPPRSPELPGFTCKILTPSRLGVYKGRRLLSSLMPSQITSSCPRGANRAATIVRAGR
jgi:peptidoglycan hydrolase CwlO-like protein